MKKEYYVRRLFTIIFMAAFTSLFVTGCQTAPEALPEPDNVKAADEEPPSGALALAPEETPVPDAGPEEAPTEEPLSTVQQLPDFRIEMEPTIFVGTYHTMEDERWLDIAWDDFEDFGLLIASGGTSDADPPAWQAGVDCSDLSENLVHFTTYGLYDPDECFGDATMVYVPEMFSEYGTETVYLDDGTGVYAFFRDIDSPYFEEYGSEPFPGDGDVSGETADVPDGTIAYFRFLTEVGRYVVQDGNYILTSAWTWTNNEVVQYGSNGRPINYRTNNSLPPVPMPVEIRVALPMSFSAAETIYQACGEEVLNMGFDMAAIATYNNTPW